MTWLWQEHAARDCGQVAAAIPAIAEREPFEALAVPNDLDRAMLAAHEIGQRLLPPLVNRSRRYSEPDTNDLSFTLMRWRVWDRLMTWAARQLRVYVLVRWLAPHLAVVLPPEQLIWTAPVSEPPDTGPPGNRRAHPSNGPPALRAARWRLPVSPP